jgi:flagellar biogenesis protein FliO
MNLRMFYQCGAVALGLLLSGFLGGTVTGQNAAQNRGQLNLPPVVHVAPISVESPSRESALASAGSNTPIAAASDLLPDRPGEVEEKPTARRLFSAGSGQVTTMVGSLAIVIGLFLMMAWFAKRNMPAGQKWLAPEIVEVLGRAPLAGKQTMHLVRLGPKLLLVSITPQGVQTLSELTEPAEVERLLVLCQRGRGGSVSESFRDVLDQFEREPADGFLENHGRASTLGAR